ncbi:MAG: hypothetical protein JSU61_09785 [Fidelibacterota bacterium]|nr:MAG: hypothetical protein JSU61_09785 [Candidatus Neomarinimicrobiota bacterium]
MIRSLYRSHNNCDGIRRVPSILHTNRLGMPQRKILFFLGLLLLLACSGSRKVLQEKLDSRITLGVMVPEILGEGRNRLELTDMISIRQIPDERRRTMPPAALYEQLLPNIIQTLNHKLPKNRIILVEEIPVENGTPAYLNMGADFYAELLLVGSYERTVDAEIPTYQLQMNAYLAFFDVDEEGSIRILGPANGYRLTTATSPVIGPYIDTIPDIDQLRSDLPPEILLSDLRLGVNVGVRKLIDRLLGTK